MRSLQLFSMVTNAPTHGKGGQVNLEAPVMLKGRVALAMRHVPPGP